MTKIEDIFIFFFLRSGSESKKWPEFLFLPKTEANYHQSGNINDQSRGQIEENSQSESEAESDGENEAEESDSDDSLSNFNPY